MKPVCVPCERFYRMMKSGYYFIEGMPKENRVRPGKKDAELWKPYKIWCGDLWACPDCGATIISGVGLHPLSEHYQEDFKKVLLATGADLLVKDC